MKSLTLFFKETTPQMEQVFNSYMQDAVMEWNEEWMAQVQHELNSALDPVFLAAYLQQKWNEMVRDN